MIRKIREGFSKPAYDVNRCNMLELSEIDQEAKEDATTCREFKDERVASKKVPALLKLKDMKLADSSVTDEQKVNSDNIKEIKNLKLKENVKKEFKINADESLKEAIKEEGEIKSWYKKEFPEDNLGNKISSTATFKGLYDILGNEEDIYNYIFIDNTGDSIVRTRIFNKLAEVMNVDSDTIYDKWLSMKDPEVDDTVNKIKTRLANKSVTEEEEIKELSDRSKYLGIKIGTNYEGYIPDKEELKDDRANIKEVLDEIFENHYFKPADIESFIFDGSHIIIKSKDESVIESGNYQYVGGALYGPLSDEELNESAKLDNKSVTEEQEINKYYLFQKILRSSKRYEFEDSKLILTDYYTGEEVKLDLSRMDEEMFNELVSDDEHSYEVFIDNEYINTFTDIGEQEAIEKAKEIANENPDCIIIMGDEDGREVYNSEN